jgi:hypothetical protein
MALVGRRPAQDAGDGQHVEEALLNAWRTGGALEMQAVMECMLSAPLDSEPDARVALCKQLLMPLATAVRIWLKDLEGDRGASTSTADTKKTQGETAKQRKTGKNKAPSTRPSGSSAGVSQTRGTEVLERIKARMTCVCVCVHVHVYTCTHTYTHTHTQVLERIKALMTCSSLRKRGTTSQKNSIS